jgi:2-polyprenyl-6-methoxyphenol hydroxylase-like FAD-dependent oxidoreductase
MKVLIVGAGPTGLTCAVELWRRGIEAEIIDKRDNASGFSRAVGITPASLEILEPSGVAENLISDGIKFHGLRVYRGEKPALAMPIKVKMMQHGYDFMLGFAQDRTETHLRNALQKLGGTVRYSTELSGLHQSDGQVKAEIAGAKPEIYDYLIGADGVRSTVRDASGIDFPGYDLPEKWSIADVEAQDWPNHDLFTLCQLTGGRVAVVVPLEAARYRLVSNTENAIEALPLPMNIGKIHRQGTFTISVRQVETYQKGRVLLAGDAAHSHSPVGGRGMNLGIADGADIAKRLAEGTSSGYTAARHADGARVIEGSERVRNFITSPSTIKRAVVFCVLKLLSISPTMQRKLCAVVLYG